MNDTGIMQKIILECMCVCMSMCVNVYILSVDTAYSYVCKCVHMLACVRTVCVCVYVCV